MATNDGGHVVPVSIGSVAADMEALDSLGPLTRRAIHDSPIRYAAPAILHQVDEFLLKFPESMRDRIRRDPQLDGMIAAGLREDARKVVQKDRSDWDAEMGIKPLVPRISAKSLREQRRSARKIKW